MPFITEEIWQHIPHEGKSIMVSQWPAEDKTIADLIDEASESSMTTIMETIKTIRALRLEVNAAPSKKSEVVLNFTDESLRQVFADNEGYLTVLASAEPVTHMAAGAEKPENAMAGMVNGVEVFLPLKGLIDVDKETARLTKELEKLDKEISRLAKKLGNEGFLAKAPADVVAGEKEKLAGYEEKKKSVEGRMQDLAKLK
jgi:valyl-tRNA synthetase